MSAVSRLSRRRARSDWSLPGKRVLVTGAARGIGRASAVELARRGARIAAVGLEPDGLASLVAELGDGHTWIEADVTDDAAMSAAVDHAVDTLGGLDVVIANAGIANFGTVRTADVAAFARTIDINLVGVYRTVHAAVPALVASRGYALAVASTASFTPLPGGAAYAASKAAVESLAASLRMELGGAGVTVGSVHPLWIDTDMVRGAENALPTFARMRSELPWPSNGTTSVADCAEAIVDAVEARATKVYVPRTAILVAMMRPLLLSGLAQRLSARRMGTDLPQLDRENEAQGATWH